MTTLKDLSRALNLSVTQVSRALNDHSDVSEATKERVRQVAKSLNYEPNLSARRLVTGRSGLVGLVLSGMPVTPQDRLFLEIVSGMSAHFSRAGYQFVLHIADPAEDVVSVYRKLVTGGGIDGFVVLEPVTNDKRIAYLKKAGVPFVLHGRDGENPDYPYFDIDNRRVGYELTRALLKAGHRRIGFLNGVRERTYAAHRAEGYRAALAEAGVDFDPALVRNATMDEGFGLRETIRLMDRTRRRPTGLIAGNTWIAKGIYAAAAALGLSVPRDLSVVAHDDLLPEVNAGAMVPPLTATESALYTSWAPLAGHLSAALSGTPVTELQTLGDARLVLRNSIAPPAESSPDGPSGAA